MKYQLKYDFNAICHLEEETGMFIGDYIKEHFGPESKKPKLLPIRKMFRAGLLHCKPDITLEQAGDIIGKELKKKGGLEKLIKIAFEAVKDAMPAELQTMLPEELEALKEIAGENSEEREERADPQESTEA